MRIRYLRAKHLDSSRRTVKCNPRVRLLDTVPREAKLAPVERSRQKFSHLGLHKMPGLNFISLLWICSDRVMQVENLEELHLKQRLRIYIFQIRAKAQNKAWFNLEDSLSKRDPQQRLLQNLIHIDRLRIIR